MSKCKAVQHSDQMVCDLCNLTWDMNDPHPPKSTKCNPIVSDNATLRDELAMAALQGILSDSEAFYQTFSALAGDCYAIADAMLKERENDSPQHT